MATLSSSDIEVSGDEIDVRAARARYSAGAILLHWLIALALAFQIALGFAMPKDERGFALFQLHKSVGVTILVLSLARLAWRLTHRPPPAVESGFNGALAKTVHTLLYVFMIGAPLTGWAIVSTDPSNIPTILYGTIPWPHLPLPDGLNDIFAEAHELLAFIALALTLLHVAGAIRHQVLIKDGLMRRMAPAGKALWVWLLAALVLAIYFGTGMRISSWVMANGGYRSERSEAPAETSAGPAPTAATPAPLASATVEPTPTPTPTDTAAVAEEAAGPPPVWSITGGKRLAFSVDNGGSAINGTFRDWAGSIVMDPDHPESAQLRITVELASASLGDATQDDMLQGPDFFGSGASPRATWRSTSVTQTAPGRYRANGTLSLKGASRPQTVTFRLTGTGLKRHVEGNATIDRNAFGIGSGESAAGLAKSVSLSFAFDAAGKAP